MVNNNSRQTNRNKRQQQLNLDLSLLPKFTPLYDCQIFDINQATSTVLLHDLIALARETTRFTIDTELDYTTHEPALIQIEFLHTHAVVLLIETCHLPPNSSVLFWLIRSLLKIICNSSNTIFSWGDLTDELTDFIKYGLFSSTTLHQLNTIDIQSHFKKWYNQMFDHTCGLPSIEDDHSLCTCLHRPVKHKHNKWSLQKAIAYTFNQFLDKSRTKSNWKQQLSHTNVWQYSLLNKLIVKSYRQHLILYAANDCLAVTKLVMVLESNWTKEQLEQYNASQQD